jgi:hypothetical protein
LPLALGVYIVSDFAKMLYGHHLSLSSVAVFHDPINRHWIRHHNILNNLPSSDSFVSLLSFVLMLVLAVTIYIYIRRQKNMLRCLVICLACTIIWFMLIVVGYPFYFTTTRLMTGNLFPVGTLELIPVVAGIGTFFGSETIRDIMFFLGGLFVFLHLKVNTQNALQPVSAFTPQPNKHVALSHFSAKAVCQKCNTSSQSDGDFCAVCGTRLIKE